MSPTELREAITGPAARAGLGLEPGLVETILADLGTEPGSLPLLSHALLETWRRRQSDTLTIDGYKDAGGIRQAIARTADTVFARLDPVGQGIAKDLFLRLTALGEGTEDTRRRARRTELLHGRDPEPVEAVLNELVRARLVILDEDSAQVAHEALIREWPMLRRWLAEDREGLRTHRRLTDAANDWDTLDRHPGALYRGARLATESPRSSRGVAVSLWVRLVVLRTRDRGRARERRYGRRSRTLCAAPTSCPCPRSLTWMSWAGCALRRRSPTMPGISAAASSRWVRCSRRRPPGCTRCPRRRSTRPSSSSPRLAAKARVCVVQSWYSHARTLGPPRGGGPSCAQPAQGHTRRWSPTTI